MRLIPRFAGGCAAVLLSACAGSSQHQLASDGLPVWIDSCEEGLTGTEICAVAESDFAQADVEAAKTDAETSAKNRLADQIEARVGRLTERLASAMKDLSSGGTVGERTLKDINRNFQETTIRGVRYVDYYFHPSRTEPEKLWVRAVISVDSNKMSREIANAMLSSAIAERLEFKHEEAQLRFDAVRKQYLDEEAAKARPAAAAAP